MINRSQEALIFRAQEGSASDGAVIDTSLDSPDDFRAPGDKAPLASTDYAVEARSIAVLVKRIVA
jgi:hypothetical protein